MNKIYSFKKQLNPLSPEQVVTAIASYEKSLRTDKVTYLEQQAFQSQIDEIKTNWPEPIRTYVRDRAREFAGQGNAVTLTSVRRALLATCEFVAQERAKVNSSTSVDFELRQLTAETNLATIFRRAPDATVAPSSISASRKYQENGKLIRVRSTPSPRNLVVNLSEIESADIYVLALYVEVVKRSILIGYATKVDLKQAKEKERADNVLPDWKKKAYYIPLEELRPMSGLYQECSLTEVPVGLAMESVPEIGSLPILAPKELQDMNKGQSKEDFDFDASVGLKSKPAAPTTKTSAPVSTASTPALKTETSAQATAAPKNSLGDLGEL